MKVLLLIKSKRRPQSSSIDCIVIGNKMYTIQYFHFAIFCAWHTLRLFLQGSTLNEIALCVEAVLIIP